MRRSAAVLARVLENGRLRRVALAFAGFSLAEYGVWTAILVYAYGRGGATAAGLIAVLQLVPAAVVAPFAAAIADRRGGAYGLFVGYVLQALAMTGTAVAMLTDAPAALVYGCAVMAAAAVTLTRPAQAKLLASAVMHPDELTAVTAVSGWIDSSSALGGPALAGITIAIDGSGAVFALFAVMVAVSALLVAPVAGAGATDAERTDADQPDGSVFAGIRSLADQRAARSVVFVLAAEHVAIGALEVLAVVLAISALGLGSSGAGYLNATFGLGATVGGFAALGLIGSRTIALPLIGAAIVWGAACALLGAIDTAVAAFALLSLSGLCQSVVNVAGRSLLARVTPLDVLGRVFGVLEGLAMAGLAVGSLMVPALVAAGGVRLALIGVAAVLVLAALAPAARLRELDQFVPAESGINAVRGHPLFAALPAPVIEGLARALSPEPTRPGQVVIGEGDVGDRFYLIAEGEFDVSVAGDHLRSLGPGQGFGEIALMRHVLRTATVVARTGGLLYALERQPFLDALRPAI